MKKYLIKFSLFYFSKGYIDGETEFKIDSHRNIKTFVATMMLNFLCENNFILDLKRFVINDIKEIK